MFEPQPTSKADVAKFSQAERWSGTEIEQFNATLEIGTREGLGSPNSGVLYLVAIVVRADVRLKSSMQQRIVLPDDRFLGKAPVGISLDDMDRE